MYEIFDEFLKSDTWQTYQSEGWNQFYRALDRVVHRPDFSAAALADHMRFKLEDSALDFIVEQLRSAAAHVRAYLVATGRIEPGNG